MNDNILRFSELLSLPPEEVHRSAGVGTLGEKYLHALLKLFFEPDRAYHEVKIGRFIADVCRDKNIYEIQTRSLDKLRDKLEYYLLEGYHVTVVFPIPHVKYLTWVDPDSGEAVPKRRSGKKGSYFDCFWELYKIKYFLDWDNLSVCLMLLNVEETRSLNGCGKSRKRRSTRLDRIPTGLFDIATLSDPADYRIFIPESLPKRFTIDQYTKACGVSETTARSGLNILVYLGLVLPAGKDGRKKLYERAD